KPSGNCNFTNRCQRVRRNRQNANGTRYSSLFIPCEIKPLFHKLTRQVFVSLTSRLERIISRSAEISDTDVSNRQPALERVMASSVQQVRDTDRCSRGGSFESRESS